MSGNNQDYDNQNDDSQDYDDENQDNNEEYDSQDDNSQNNGDHGDDDEDCDNDDENNGDDDDDNGGDEDNDDGGDDGENNSNGPKYIRLRGLPWSATHKEILDFLKNVNVIGGASGIHLITSRWDGKNTGEAYVEVKGQQDVIAAMKLDNATMGHRYIEVFNAAPREAKEAMRKTSSHGNSYVVKLRGLPYSVTEQQVEEFFNGLEIKPDREGIIFVMDRRGRATGEAFVQFESQEDTEQALGRNREKIGHRYIEIFRSSLAELRRSTNGNGRSAPYDLRDRGSNRGGGSGGGGNDYGNSSRNNRGGGGGWGNNGGFGVGANNTLGFNNLPNFGSGGGGGGNFGNFGGSGGRGGGGSNGGMNNFGNFGNNGGGNGNYGGFDSNSGGNFGNSSMGNNSGGSGFNRFSGNSGNFGNDFGDFGNFGNNRGNNSGSSNMGGGMSGGGMGSGNNGGGGFNNFGNFGNNMGGGGGGGSSSFGGSLTGGFAGNMSGISGGVSGGNFGPIGGGRNDDYYVVLMRGLPFSSFENDVFKFFEPLRPANVRIHFQKRSGRHNGTAEALFESYEDAQLAMKRHRCKMGQRYIELLFNGKSSKSKIGNNYSSGNSIGGGSVSSGNSIGNSGFSRRI